MQSHRGKEADSDFVFVELRPLEASPSGAVIVYLHGSGERGTDLSLVTRFGLPAAASAGRAHTNCPIFCPQLAAQNDWESSRVAHFIRWVKNSYSKVALIGYSWGASGVCSAVADLGAVANVCIAIAGQAPVKPIANQRATQFLAIQGELDSWPITEHFIRAINEHGGSASSVVLPGMSHYISEEALAHPALLSLLQTIGIEIVFREDTS